MNEDLERIDDERQAGFSDDEMQEDGALSSRSNLRYGGNYAPRIKSMVDQAVVREYENFAAELEASEEQQPPMIKHAKSF